MHDADKMLFLTRLIELMYQDIPLIAVPLDDADKLSGQALIIEEESSHEVRFPQILPPYFIAQLIPLFL